MDSYGLSLQVFEWGDPAGEPVLLCHGMFDHGRGFDLLAPRLSEGFRVVSFDARGHGDSDWAESYAWPADVADIVNVVRAIGRPAHLVGHSKGGGQATDAAIVAPTWVRKIVNLDGFGPPPEDGETPRPRRHHEGTTPERFAEFLDRRRSGRREWRPYASFEALIERRSQQNPRLSREWLRYFLHWGSRADADGWRWKVDPHAGHGFGPFRPEWIGPSYRKLRAPMLAVTGSEPDTWGPLPEPLLRERLSEVPVLERAVVEDAGHFMHMERPDETAEVVLRFLGSGGA